MSSPLHVLIVEDSPDDARLILRELTRGGFTVTSHRVDQPEAFGSALSDPAWQIILCDHSMPHFSGTAALQIVKAHGLDVPFIYVSGTIGEEAAVEAMKAGASDYVMKDRLARLVPAVQRELRESAERRRAQAELRKQARMNDALFNQAISCFALIGRDGRFISVNDAYAAYYGHPKEYFAGRSVLEMRSAATSVESAQAMIDTVVRTKVATRNLNHPYVFSDQPERGVTYWDSILQPILDEHGEVEFLFFSSVEVTERRRAEEALRANSARLLQQEAALIALTRDAPGNHVDLTSSLRRITDIASRTLDVARVGIWRLTRGRSALVCLDQHELAADRHDSGMEISAADCPRHFQALAADEVIAADDVTEEPRLAELLERHLRPAGVTSLLDVPIVFNGELAGVVRHEHVGPPRQWTFDERTFAVASANVVALVLEEAERREAERALRQSQEAYAALVNSIDGIVWEAEAETLRFTFVSDKAERLLGYPTSRWLSDPDFWKDHLHPVDAEWAVDFCRRSVERLEDHDFKYRMIAADGREVWLHDLVTVSTPPDRPAMLRGIMVDITEAKQAERALRASEQRFRQVTETIDEVFWLTDVDKSEMIYVSPAYARVWGRSCESLVADARSWIDAIHPDDRERVREASHTRQVLGQYDLEYRVLRPDGTVRWVHDRAFPITDTGGRIYRIAGVAEDVTERRALEDQLRQAQKMEAIGQLAGGVAHDFNNLLAVIEMQASLLLAVPASQTDVRDGLQQILAASERAANLTRQLLTFSRRGLRQSKDIDLVDVTDGMTRLLRRILGEDIALETRIAPGLPLVNADPGMMEQVLMNLAVNARDAMPGGGRLLVGLDTVTVSPAEAAVRPRASAGQFVRLRVVDTGCGIPEHALPRIFEPFFTTKEPGKGTGLGLATVFGIVEQHKGWIDVTSEVGKGTTVEVYLPALTPSRAKPREAATDGRLPAGSETILIVEDDPAVRDLARVSLEHCGYHVYVADSAAMALALVERLDKPLDLLLTDLIMPGGISGRELAERLVARQPGLKVIYSSGYSNDIVHRELRVTAGQNYIQKPYPVTGLAAMVRRCLDTP